MYSSHNIELALKKAQRNLLLRFLVILLVCLTLVQAIVGTLFFFDLYRVEKKLLNSMASEYQRILTYDSADKLIHVLEANPHRLLENDIAAYAVQPDTALNATFIAGASGVSTDIPFSDYINNGQLWVTSFLLNPYMSTKITGEQQDFWLVLKNESRYFIAYNQWAMTFYMLILLVVITALFTRKMINSAISPLITLGNLLDRLKHDQLEPIDTSTDAPLGFNVITSSVHDAVARLHNVKTALNITVDAIAHDIRTPLSRIMLASQSALLNDDNPPAMREALADCSEYATQAGNMLTTLMKLNDEVIGKRIPQSIPTNVSEVVSNVASWYQDVADDKQIKLNTVVPDDIVIQSDPDKLIQVLVNVVDNAIKYTGPNGQVSIEARQYADGKTDIKVVDTGIGIDSKYQGLIFERLYRVDSSRSNTDGYGLGLSFAAAVVENLGGTISVESEVGVGSVFTLSFYSDC